MRVRVSPAAPKLSQEAAMAAFIYTMVHMQDITTIALENDDKIPVIDLHESDNIDSALEQLEKELFSYYQKGEKYIKVVHGIGTGVLEEKLVEQIKLNPLIKDFAIGKSGYLFLEI